jgi:hypothetical protein
MLNYYNIEANCKYRLPCGWCDRKNTMCTQFEYQTNPLTLNDLNNSWRNVKIPEACRTCPSHPSNGGSGLCSCSLAYPNTTTIYGNTATCSQNITAGPSLSLQDDMTVTITKDDVNNILTQTEGEISNA